MCAKNQICTDHGLNGYFGGIQAVMKQSSSSLDVKQSSSLDVKQSSSPLVMGHFLIAMSCQGSHDNSSHNVPFIVT